jgi:hypothetical protein
MTDGERRQSLGAWERVDRSPITEDERKYLCANLRADATALTPRFARHNLTAANEIERLENEVARLKDENGVIREQCQNMLDMTVR